MEGMVNEGKNPKSRIMRGGWSLRKESKIQSSESGSRVVRDSQKREESSEFRVRRHFAEREKEEN